MANHYNVFVPDEGPADARILFVGDSPGGDEHEQKRPFIGTSGQILITALSNLGVEREEVRLANLCHYRPYQNRFDNLIGTDALKEGISLLHQYIKLVKPHVIVPLGAHPLEALTGKTGIGKWRGSIISYIHDETIKVIPTYHPAAVLRDASLYPTFKIDLARIIQDSNYREFNLPQRRYIIDPRGLDLEEWTQRLCNSPELACDIETVRGSQHILCVGFAPSKDVGVCIVPLDEARKSAISRILASSARKIFQFGTFDYRQLTDNGYQVIDLEAQELGRLYWADTMVMQHVLAPELPRSLGYLTSVLTREPYYKTEGRGNVPNDSKSWSLKANKEALYVYNAKDCCCTFEIYEQLMPDIESDIYHPETFDFEMSMLETFDELGASGMFVDEERRQLLEEVLVARWAKRQFVLDRLCGYVTNVHSPKLANILYDKDKVGLPVRKTREGRVTTKEDAIVGLIAFCKGKLEEVVREDTILQWKVKLAICETILEIRGIRKNLSSYILAQNKKGIKRARPDGRVHSVYKITTETARTASSKYHDGTGFNAQTLPRDPVDVPDELLTLAPEGVKLILQLDTNDDELEEGDEEN